ncbi:ABC transporter permease [uncultured Corynebacterium sp.]|uniref:ABC transporter permease n=1 Tax=uncultured Corynebacterium sp. TaxID=159447 RepID=UPI0025F8432C|nr:ABC transporter permease [uncultured Corynebacterium sp.]
MTDRPTPGTGTPETTDHLVYAMPQKKSAYRRWYAAQHPNVQMVLSQLWMPVFMLTMFILCYVAPFQHASPRDVPIGVVGTVDQTRTLQAAADRGEPGAIAFETVTDHATAQQKVTDGNLAAAYDVDTDTLVTASALQAQAATIIPRIVTPLLPALGQDETPTVEDLAPLPAHDIGMTPMYLMIAWCISGYLAAMFVGLMGGPLGRRVRFFIIACTAVLLSFISALLVSPVLGAVEGHFWALWGLGFVWAFAIGAAVNGVSYFVGRFVAVPAMLMFIFLSMPSSGGALPIWMMPRLFEWLSHVVVGSGITGMLKELVYGVGPGYAHGWVMIVCYIVAGVLLSLVGKPFRERRLIRRILRGRTTMFQDAQRAAGRHGAVEQKKVLAAHGLTVRESDGAVLRIPPEAHHRGLREKVGEVVAHIDEAASEKAHRHGGTVVATDGSLVDDAPVTGLETTQADFDDLRTERSQTRHVGDDGTATQ